MNAIEVTGVVAGYGQIRILNGMNLHVARGETVCLIGPNGAGKSTMLKAIAGLLPWEQGVVRIGGTAARSGSTGDEARSSLGYVPQVRNIFTNMTTVENLDMFAPRRSSRRQKKERIDAVLDLFPALKPMRNRMGGLMSGGERQLLALGMALMNEPEVLLLDEPSAALSPVATQSIFEVVRNLCASGISILLVEQNVQPALEISDRCYVLEAGSVALEGDAKSLLDDPRIKTVYLGGGAAAE